MLADGSRQEDRDAEKRQDTPNKTPPTAFKANSVASGIDDEDSEAELEAILSQEIARAKAGSKQRYCPQRLLQKQRFAK